MVRFDDVHAFSYNSAGSKPIWMKFGALSAHCLALALADFGRDPRRRRERESQANFLSGKQHAISPTSRRPNFTKFAHKTCIDEVVNPFGTGFFENFPVRGRFFQKRQIFRQNLQPLATLGPYHSLTI